MEPGRNSAGLEDPGIHEKHGLTSAGLQLCCEGLKGPERLAVLPLPAERQFVGMGTVEMKGAAGVRDGGVFTGGQQWSEQRMECEREGNPGPLVAGREDMVHWGSSPPPHHEQEGADWRVACHGWVEKDSLGVVF